MSERAALTKTSENKGKNPVGVKPKENFYESMDSPVEQILSMQQTIGNQAVQRLLASGTIQAKLTIGKPNDKYEQEADRVADKVMSMPEPKGSLVNGHSSLVQRQIGPEEEEKEPIQTKPLAEQITPLVQRQVGPEEEEEPVQTKLLQRQAEPEEEEEPVQTKLLQRQEAEEEEEPVQTKRIQRQEAEEEEEPVQTKLQRQAEKEEEEEPVQTKLVQRQVNPEEEEETQTKLQRQPEDEEEEPIQKQPLEEEEEEEKPIQTKPAHSQTPAVTSNIESSVNSLKGGGQPLPESTRSYFEPRFGEDFSQVRLHTDSKAADTAKSINAKAFTKGKDVVFGAGQYSSETSTGKRLLAHELTHVVQQGNVIRRQPTSARPTKTLNIPVIGQHWMQLFYWEHYWKPSIKKADAEQWYATLLDIDDLIYKLNDEIIKTKYISYYKKRGRRGRKPRINPKAKRFIRSIYVIHRKIIEKLKPKVKRKTLERLRRNYSSFLWWWSTSGEKACAEAAARLMRYGKAKIRASNKPAFTTSKRVKVIDTNWYKSKFGSRKVRLYKGRHVNYQLKYSKKRLLTLEKFIIKRINSGKPVHVRVLTAFIHFNYGKRPKSIHSIVINKYIGTVATNGKVRFGFLDPDNAKKGELILDPNRSEDEKNSRFQSDPIGNPKWTNFGTTSKPEWFFGGNGPPWRYQVIRVDY